MKSKISYCLILFCFLTNVLSSQTKELKGIEANQYFEGSSLVLINPKTESPKYIKLKEGTEIDLSEFLERIKTSLVRLV